MIKIADKRLQHVLVPVTVLTLGLQEIGLYTLLAHWAVVETSPDSETQMAKQIGVAVNTLRKYLGLLEEKGFLTITLSTKVNEAGETIHDGSPMEITLIDQTPLLPTPLPKPTKKVSLTPDQRAYMVAFSPHGTRFLEPEFAPARGRLFSQWKKVKAIFGDYDLTRLPDFIEWFNNQSPLAKKGKAAWSKYSANQAHAPICALSSPERFCSAYVEWLTEGVADVPDYIDQLIATGMSRSVALLYSEKGAKNYLKMLEEDEHHDLFDV